MHRRSGSIVVGVDGSPHAARALLWAIKQATVEHRRLTLVHAINSASPAFIDAAIVDSRSSRSILEMAGQQVLDEARASVEGTAPDLEVHEAFALADPRDVLLQLSEKANMLVVGSRGRGRVRSLLLGSVSAALVQHAHCPVVVVRPEHDGLVRNGILVGFDASPESRPVLEFAYREAYLHQLPLTVLECRWDVQLPMGTDPVSNAIGDLESEGLVLDEATTAMRQKYPDVHVTTRTARGLPQVALSRLGEPMDLIVVGTHHHGRISRVLLGSVSVAVVESATCPVAVVPLFTYCGPDQTAI